MSFSSSNAMRQKLQRFSLYDQKRIDVALKVIEEAHKGQMRKDGKPYVSHPIAVAEILCDWGADADTIIAGLLHDTVEDTSLRKQEIEQNFGGSVADLVEGVTKFTQLDFQEKDSLDEEVETLRKLFDVMRKDIRAMLVKLADRLHNLQTIQGLSSDRRITFAKESLDVYYKVAYHLGMNEYCREVTNICVPYVYPQKAEIRERHWKEQKKPVEDAIQEIQKEVSNEGGVNIIEVRMVKSSHDLPRIQNQDEAADRAYYCVMIVPDEDSCYSVFKVLHRLYHPVRRRFHDYIASPPESGYRSLHTTIIGPNGKLIQIRIRTPEMDQQVKWGVLQIAFGNNDENAQSFSWLKRSEDLDRSTRESSEAFWEALQSDIFQKSIQITVNGSAISVPSDSTALDTVYWQYGTDAHVTSTIHVNGKLEEYSTSIQEDDAVEVSFDTRQKVDYSWLQYVHTKHARNYIVEALKVVDRAEKFALGQELLQKELDHFQKKLLGEISKSDQERVARFFRRENFEQVIVMVGEGVLSPREVILALEKGSDSKVVSKPYNFRVRVRFAGKHREEIISQVSTLARTSDVKISSLRFPQKDTSDLSVMEIAGKALEKIGYADFVAALERHSWISQIHTLMSFKQKVFLFSSCACALLFLAADLLLLTYLGEWVAAMPYHLSIFLQIGVILPPLLVNFYVLQILRDYIPWLRKDRWFLPVILLANFVVSGLIIYEGVVVGLINQILPIFSIFVLFLFYIGYRFIHTEELFAKAAVCSIRPLSDKQWKKIRKKKIVGYMFRLGAVCIWGIQPLYIRYTPASTVDPFVRVFFTGIGVLLVTALIIAIKQLQQKKQWTSLQLRIPHNILLFNIIAGYILFTYFLNSSLQFTTSTNFILFNNFSPVVALLIGAMLWRNTLPYMQEPRSMLWIFLVFLMGSTGSAFIIFNSLHHAQQGTVYGDVLGLLAMIADTLLVVSQIRYMKLYSTVSSLLINLHVFLWHIIAISPLIAWFIFTKHVAVTSLTIIPVLYATGAGVLASIGQICNYETFRRVDGFIAFLMFNISILVTFVTEVFFLNVFAPTWVLIFGGFTIILSTILAEVINSYYERKGYAQDTSIL